MKKTIVSAIGIIDRVIQECLITRRHIIWNMVHNVSCDPPPLWWILKRFIVSPFDWAQPDEIPAAPIFFSTPLLWLRYQNLARLEERCRWLFYNSLQNPKRTEKSRKISVLHKAFTVFAYRIRAPPSEV